MAGSPASEVGEVTLRDSQPKEWSKFIATYVAAQPIAVRAIGLSPLAALAAILNANFDCRTVTI